MWLYSLLLQLTVTKGLRVCAWDADVTEFDHGGSIIMKSVSHVALVGRTISGFSFLFFFWLGRCRLRLTFPMGLARHINNVCLSDSLIIFLLYFSFMLNTDNKTFHFKHFKV